jgi:hypothetical protein
VAKLGPPRNNGGVRAGQLLISAMIGENIPFPIEIQPDTVVGQLQDATKLYLRVPTPVVPSQS